MMGSSSSCEFDLFWSGCNGFVLLMLCSSLSSFFLSVLMHVLMVFMRAAVLVSSFNIYVKMS